MPIVAADLKAFGSANHAEDDTSLQGGAISTVKRVEFTPIAANDDLEAISDNAADTMNLTITGISPDDPGVAFENGPRPVWIMPGVEQQTIESLG